VQTLRKRKPFRGNIDAGLRDEEKFRAFEFRPDLKKRGLVTSQKTADESTNARQLIAVSDRLLVGWCLVVVEPPLPKKVRNWIQFASMPLPPPAESSSKSHVRRLDSCFLVGW
jgi:hypothetical protein